MQIYFGLIVCFSQALLTSLVISQEPDRIWLEPKRPTSFESDWNARGVQKVTAKIIEFDGTKISYVVTGDEAETVASSARVLWIERGDVDDLEAEAIQFFADGQYSESLTKLPIILKQRPPVWRQQWLTMMAANAAWKSRRSKIALELVSQLDRRPLPLMTISWLPIAWKNGTQPSDAIAQAKQRLEDPSLAVQLVAASWLLSSANRSEAIDTLKTLQRGPKPNIAALAEALLWRSATPPQVTQQYKSWQKKIDGMPMVLQTGPTITLIDKLRSAGLSDAADPLQWSLELTPIHPVN